MKSFGNDFSKLDFQELLDSADKYSTFSKVDQLKAEAFYKAAFAYLDTNMSPLQAADFYYRKSKLEMYRGNAVEGEQLCKLALNEIKDESLSMLYFHIKHRLGNAYYYANQYNRAINEYLDIIYMVKVDSNFSDEDVLELKMIEAYSYNNIAGINYVLFAEENAIEYYKKSAKLFSELGNETMLKYCYFSIASAYIDKGEYVTAKENMDIGFSLVDRKNMTIDLGDFYLVYSHYFLETGLNDSALTYINLAKDIFIKYEDEISINKADIFTGSYLFQIKNYVGAIKVLEESYKILNKEYSNRLQLKTELLLAESYSKTGNYRKAYDYVDKALKSHEKILLNHEQFFEYELENRIKVNQAYFQDSIQTISDHLKLEKIKSDLKEKSTLNQFLIIAVVVFLLITVALFYIVNRIRKINKKLKKSINENTVLFKEVHHRVKNNFQIISSLMNLQKMAVDKPEIDSILNETQQRINSMSLVHELLYQYDEVDSIDISNYVQELVSSIEKSYSNANNTIQYHIEMNDIELVLEKAIPLGLILNEAITNAMKHAFIKNEGGDIWIELTEISEGYYQLTVRDNGVGIAENLSPNDN